MWPGKNGWTGKKIFWTLITFKAGIVIFTSIYHKKKEYKFITALVSGPENLILNTFLYESKNCTEQPATWSPQC